MKLSHEDMCEAWAEAVKPKSWSAWYPGINLRVHICASVLDFDKMLWPEEKRAWIEEMDARYGDPT